MTIHTTSEPTQDHWEEDFILLRQAAHEILSTAQTAAAYTNVAGMLLKLHALNMERTKQGGEGADFGVFGKLGEEDVGIMERYIEQKREA